MPSNHLTDIFESAADDPKEKNIHKLRTTLRRCEGVLQSSAYSLSEKERATLKRLKKVRKAAGQVRDLDIQISLLGTDEFKVPLMNGGPLALQDELRAARKKAARKLRDELKQAGAKRLSKKASALCFSAKAELPQDVLNGVIQQLQHIARVTTIENADALHDVRIELKKMRYTLEAVGNTSHAGLVASLKRVHDAIGEWHDWTTLAEVAGEYLPRRSSVVTHARRKAASLFQTALEETERFLAPYRQTRKWPVAAFGPAKSVEIRA